MEDINCLGQDFKTGCGTYSGPDIPALDITFGENLDTVLLKIANATNTDQGSTSSQEVTTDNIKSKSKVRGGSLCASSIVKRDFAYSLSTNSAGTIFTYDLVPIISALPKGYELAVARVIASGQPIQGIGVITDSRSVANSLNIPLTRYPAVIDILLRITSPCGQIDMTKRIDLLNPAKVGQFRSDLEASDLNPSSGEVMLSDQLDNLEERTLSIERRLQEVGEVKSTLADQSLTIDEIKSKVDSPDTLSVNYTKNGGETSDEITTLVTDLYAQVKSLNDKIAAQTIELTSLRSQINAT